uniref:Doublecortin domain-containing protein n=2 Tax=Monopterus albus TaxID=43700 RepID=A0A3Q3JIG6_MONAL
MWDPQPHSKHASPLLVPPPSNFHLVHVTRATPAKWITFYKSGDSQFGGVRMAINKRRFKCFDALLDDLSQKVPLPFGVRTVTTPHGTHTIKQLEQLQDGGCYLCSDRRQAKPINMELASQRPSIWHRHSRRPQQPETPPATPPGYLTYRPRRILLVKNSNPGMRRSIVLNRMTTRSLKAFLEKVSKVMQFHVCKIYTAEGHRIDSMQRLMTCPGVLVCVGREAFHPMLINFIRKNSEEKLPGLGPRTPGNGAQSPVTQGTRSHPHGAQSRGSENSNEHENKKNINFGLETKKSIIHPRSDSSNRSARFSLSSEKSYSNGVNVYSQARPAITNDDIQKRVLVNKDGSLSVEMRVHFRLHNEETLKWSTQIKKSPSLTNDSCPVSQDQPHYLQQGQSESCSDPDSMSFEPDDVDYSNQPLQHAEEVNHCPCRYQRQEQQYDLWENPAHSHKHPPVPPLHPHTSSHTHTMIRHTNSSSSSSSCNSRRVVHCRARISTCRGGSGTEQSQLVQEEMCVTEQVERRVEVEQDGDTQVEVCRVSRCCSHSEVVAKDSNLRPLSRSSVENELMMDEEEEHPLFVFSSSSHTLQSLKKDQNDEDDDDMPSSASQCCHSNEPSPFLTSKTHLNGKPTSNVSAGSVHSTEHTKHDDREERGSRSVSAASSCHCGAVIPHSAAGADNMDRAPRSKSKMSTSSCSSSKIPNLEDEGPADVEDEEVKRSVSDLSGPTDLSAGSQMSGASGVCPKCEGWKREANSYSNSKTSQRSHRSHQAFPNSASPLCNQEDANNGSDDAAESIHSNKTNLTNYGQFSAISNVPVGRGSSAMSKMFNPEPAGNEEERAPSATSATSHISKRSQKSGCNCATGVTTNKEEERGPSTMSAQSNLSAKSSKSFKSNSRGPAEATDIRIRKEAEGENANSLSAKCGVSAKTTGSVKSHCLLSGEVAFPTDSTVTEEGDTNIRAPSSLSVKSTGSTQSGKAATPDSALSAESQVTTKSSTSHRVTCSHCAKAISPGAKLAATKATGQEEGTEAEERAVSPAKSNLSVKSNKSHQSSRASISVMSEVKGDGKQRVASQLSAGSVNVSVKSSKSCRTNCNDNETAGTPSLKVGENAEEKDNKMVEVETQQQPESVTFAKSEREERAASSGPSRPYKSNSNGKLEADSEKEDNTGGDLKVKDQAASPLSGTSASSTKSCHIKTDRFPSAMSGKLHTSSKASRSTASPSPSETNVPSIETNVEEKPDEMYEQVANAMSVKSNSSVRSCTSQKSNSVKTLKPSSPSSNVVTIKKAEGVDGAGIERTKRAPSAASVKSNVSSHNRTASVAADTDEKVVEVSAPRICSPQTHSPKPPASSSRSPRSPVQQLSGPGGEAGGPSALLVHTATSAKSGRPKCRCRAASAIEKAKKEIDGVEREIEKRKEKSEEASEQTVHTMSFSSIRQRRESGGTEQPLSQNSSGSVSLGLPENQDTADSDKSSVSFHANTESKGRVKTSTPNVPKSTMERDVEGTGTPVSQRSSTNGSKSTLSHNPEAVDIPTIETPGGCKDEDEEGGGQKTERTAGVFSGNSSRSHRSSCNCSVKAAAQILNSTPKEEHGSASPAKAGNDLETESVKSASATKASNLDTCDNRTSSAMSSASAKVQSKSPASANVAKTTAEDSANNDHDTSRSANKAKGKGNIRDKTANIHSNSPCCLRPESTASVQSGTKKKASKQSKRETLVKSNGGSNNGSVKESDSQKKETPIKPLSPCPLYTSRPCSRLETHSESTVSRSLSAADLLKESMAAAHSHSKTSDNVRSEKSTKSQRSRTQKDQQEELTPACLPSTSPTEVVSDWLRTIPNNSSMLTTGEELTDLEQEMEEKPGKEVAKEEESAEGEEKKTEAEEEEWKDGAVKCNVGEEEEKSSDPVPGDAVVEEMQTSSHPNTLLLPRNWHSSAAVMKVLLSSSLGRCRSMPEVSPVYGRRLSTSARGLLDCLAQLQLIEPAVSLGCDQQKEHNQQYEGIMDILQSLWLTEPRDTETKEAKDLGTEQVSPPRSSSGVDMSSGSGGSGKENRNQGGNETLPKETESLLEGGGAAKVVEEENEVNTQAEVGEMEVEPEVISTDRVEEPVQGEEQSTVPPKATENPLSSDKSSANNSSKSPTDNEQEAVEDSSSGTPPTVLQAPLSRRPSQDPDPLWVLHLLKKLEKQFIKHYTDAMAEFKVRWDLDDSLMLDKMILELKDEVCRRIQSSISREMKKIQSRAGRGWRSPRPPQGGNLSRESTMTEKRRQMLKVMKNQSVKTTDSLSNEEMTAEFSDQQSDDKYCPCDACFHKKMAAWPLKTNMVAADTPVMMEFDLLKILQMKKIPSAAPAVVPQSVDIEGDSMVADEEGRNSEVLLEEKEEDDTKEDIKADVVLEETILEEDKETRQEEDGGEAGAEEAVAAEIEGDEELEVRETGGEKAGEEEGSENGQEEEEEVEAQCQCHAARNEDESNKEGSENGQEEEEEVEAQCKC